MSSIYRKGRDGYFYYQTYLFNPETKKKDKRIFHALNTKIRSKAEQKKNELDKKYEEKSKYKNISSQNKFILFILIVFTISYLIQKNSKNNYYSFNFETKANNLEIIVKDTVKWEKDRTFKNNNNITPVKLNRKHSYKIVNIEKVATAFNQCKISVLVSDETMQSDYISICEIISMKYKEYSNIVICLYSDTKNGKLMALGKDNLLTQIDKKETWLAFYSYNDVEGVYFDENPTSYMGFD